MTSSVGHPSRWDRDECGIAPDFELERDREANLVDLSPVAMKREIHARVLSADARGECSMRGYDVFETHIRFGTKNQRSIKRDPSPKLGGWFHSVKRGIRGAMQWTGSAEGPAPTGSGRLATAS
jgi:hypothetical protein